MNGWISLPWHWQEDLNQNMAIRKYCAARLEEQDHQSDWQSAVNEIEDMWSASDTSSPPCLGALDEAEFVHSFINTECYDESDATKSAVMSRTCGGGFPNNLETFSMHGNVYGEIAMNEEEDLEMCCSIEDLGVAPVVMPSSIGEVRHGVDQGLHLVHLLLACAEAVGCRDTRLATSMLDQVWASANPWGDSLQRVSFCFANGLKSRLSLLQHVSANGTFANAAIDVPLITREEKMEGFHLLHQSTPYIAFGFMAANEAICHASHGKDSLHIIDLGAEHALQWPSLIRTLASRPEGPPRLRITGIGVGHNLPELEASMKILIDEARSLRMSLESRLIVESSTPHLLNAENLHLREGEVLFVNSTMHLHIYVKESRGSLKAILQAIRKLNPTLLTVVEQDANHNGPFFLGRFLESLHYYSAIFDSLEASLPRPSIQRMKIERSHFAEEIRNIVAYEGSDRVERHERADQWRRQLGRAGFQTVGLKSMSQARMMLSLYGCEGYTLASEKGCLLLGWKGRPIMLASAWQVHSVSST